MKTKTEKEKMLNGENYFAFDNELKKARKATFNATMKFNTTGKIDELNKIFYRKFENLIINPPFYCDYLENIKIGKNCWLGGGVIVLAGVNIGEGTTIGAGSVVVHDIPSNCTAAGNPCKVIRCLN